VVVVVATTAATSPCGDDDATTSGAMSFSISNNGSCDANAHSRRQTNTDRQTDRRVYKDGHGEHKGRERQIEVERERERERESEGERYFFAHWQTNM